MLPTLAELNALELQSRASQIEMTLLDCALKRYSVKVFCARLHASQGELLEMPGIAERYDGGSLHANAPKVKH